MREYTGKKDSKGKDIKLGDTLYFAVYNAKGKVVWNDNYMTYFVELENRPPCHRQNGSLFDFVTSVGWCDSYEVTK